MSFLNNWLTWSLAFIPSWIPTLCAWLTSKTFICTSSSASTRSSTPPCSLKRTSDHNLNDTYATSRLTLQKLKTVAQQTMCSAPDYETRLWLHRVDCADLEMVDGRLLNSQMITPNLLGRGTYGYVYRIDLVDVGYPVCVKLARGRHYRENNLRECEFLSFLREVKGVPRVLGISMHPDAFIMTMHGDCTLSQLISSWRRLPSEVTMLRLLRDLCSVLVEVHQRQLSHNDIKANNVMVEINEEENHPVVTLIDFGVMTPYGQFPFRRSPNRDIEQIKPFYDPDLIRGKTPCSEATDMYSMGYLMRRTLSCFQTKRNHITVLCNLAMGPVNERLSFSDLKNILNSILYNTNCP